MMLTKNFSRRPVTLVAYCMSPILSIDFVRITNEKVEGGNTMLKLLNAMSELYQAFGPNRVEVTAAEACAEKPNYESSISVYIKGWSHFLIEQIGEEIFVAEEILGKHYYDSSNAIWLKSVIDAANVIKVGNRFALSSRRNGKVRPGIYDSEETVRQAVKLSNETLYRAQEIANIRWGGDQLGVITEPLLKLAASNYVETPKKAYSLIDSPNKWVQGSYATTKNRTPICSTDTGAYCFCGQGAINNVYGFYTDQRALVMHKVLHELAKQGFYTIVAWNDAPGRTQQEVYELFKRLDI